MKRFLEASFFAYLVLKVTLQPRAWNGSKSFARSRNGTPESSMITGYYSQML